MDSHAFVSSGSLVEGGSSTLGGDLGPLGLCVVFGSWKQGSPVVDAFVWRELGNPAATAGGIFGLDRRL